LAFIIILVTLHSFKQIIIQKHLIILALLFVVILGENNPIIIYVAVWFATIENIERSI